MATVAIVGAGLVGQGWAIVFARAGWDVRLHDLDGARAQEAATLVLQQLHALQEHGLMRDAHAAGQRVAVAASLREAVSGVDYVQENSPEREDVKRAVFSELDALCSQDVVIGSSTSSIQASRFTEHLAHRERCLVVHPVNPPYLIPVVELCGAPWTSPAAVARAKEIMRDIGQQPVVVAREVEGFVLNRLQGALLHEAFRLAQAGIATAEDIDATIKHGLGLRWSFMGPFETIDLNAPGGLADYCSRYKEMYKSMAATQAQCVPWEGELVEDLTRQRRALLDEKDLVARRFWRDDKLMQLMRHKLETGETNGQAEE